MGGEGESFESNFLENAFGVSEYKITVADIYSATKWLNFSVSKQQINRNTQQHSLPEKIFQREMPIINCDC